MTAPRRKFAYRPPLAKKTAVTFVIPTTLLKQIDAIAVKEERPRSHILEMAARKFVADTNAA